MPPPIARSRRGGPPPEWIESTNVKDLPRNHRVLLGAALLLVLAALLLHASVYAFLTDDAFISFRYAVNLAQGHGLVFNPGHERVEGYTNFLWVVLLAGANRVLGLAPEDIANPLLLVFTVVLWGLVARTALEGRDQGEPWWPALIAPALLALTRSFAVWSTSGLETRLFELLVVAAIFRLLTETRTLSRAGGSGAAVGSPFPWSGVLFALATLTRPDGALMAGCALLAAWATLRPLWPLVWRTGVAQGLLFAAPVLAHTLWRRSYYGEWLPNTYYAKVGGLTWWDMGGAYLGTFVLEYGVFLWPPLLALAVLRHARKGTTRTPLLYAAVVVPHALYVARIGGDHFEYRPIDLYLPFLFLLMADGVREATDRIQRLGRRARVAWTGGAAAYAVLLLVGLTWIPWQSHRQFPAAFVPGFPGVQAGSPLDARYLRPEDDVLMRWPGFRAWGEAHRRLLRTTTARLAGIRAEEHRLFLAEAEETGSKLRRLVEQGVLPSDTYIATSAAGVIPYRSGLRTLDRLGLTDREVARTPPVEPRRIGHDRHATVAYAAGLGVDLWAEDPVHLLFAESSERLAFLLDDARRAERDVYFADLGGDVLVVRFPQGAERALARFPRLDFRSVPRDADALVALRERMTEAGRVRLLEQPGTVEAEVAQAMALAAAGDVAGAIAELERASEPGDPRVLVGLGTLHASVGQHERAAAYLQEATRVAPELLGLHYNLGLSLLRLERWTEARAAFSAAVRLEPADPAAHFALGSACLALDARACVEAQAAALDRIGTQTSRELSELLREALRP